MINGLNNRNMGRVELPAAPIERGAATSRAEGASSARASDAATTGASQMAAQGAPIDMDKVAAIKAAIAEGRYPVDPEKIAEKMIELDLPDHRE